MGCNLQSLDDNSKELRFLNSLFKTKSGTNYKKYACVESNFSKGYNYSDDYTNKSYSYVKLHSRRRYNYIAIDLDIDCDLYSILDDSMLPIPNVIIQSKKSGHFHLVYCLADPIYKYGRSEPLNLSIYNDTDQPLINDLNSTLTINSGGTIDLNITDSSINHNLSMIYEVNNTNFTINKNGLKAPSTTGTYHIKIKIKDQVLHYAEQNLTITVN